MPTLTASPSYASRAASLSQTRTGKVLIGLAATVVIVVAARLSIPLPFTPVPLTLQPLAVLGVGLALGPVEGFLVLLAYLAEGAIGLPVFSPTGLGGVAQVLGPTGGYLMAYPFVAALAGGTVRLLNTRTSRFLASLVAGILAMALLYACGALWFAQYTHHSLYATWIGAVAPFLPGEIVKIFAAAGIYSALTRPRRIV
ncbi:biotin transporter BioY [Granulicella sp. 5B5]|uniref:biotin transporter BioY n=1 Tax=Granulicella sp. 5B5 TaxID=1617967 RepID=UPI0015F5B8F4|nr:biotin transporter BioY [Granulicella sp. 5B5]QMV17334.1 biotin transporter BioY [Granulicella sp. 5B5]